ncbi:MAG TPA: hypothetical protein VFX98_00845 [Longimicrobiaceae bacterium]|nr:hypothetical protein [Longimicrobiaceae bacterium]
MTSEPIESAFALFRARAASRGLAEPDEHAAPGASGSRVATVSRQGAALRLAWDGEAGVLALEITHGPPGGPVSWMDLFRLPSATDDETGFASALEYGLDLLCPDRPADGG